MIYSEVTEGYLVEAEPTYVPEHSHPEEAQFFFAYRIRITNQNGKKAQLQRRHWIIVDGRQNREEVEGEGVVGETPHFAVPLTNIPASAHSPLPQGACAAVTK